jgi:phosphomannomutase
MVLAKKADIGLALDADGDRLALIDEQGRPLGEDFTVTLAVRHVLSRRPGPVVVSSATSRMIEDVAAQFSCPVHRVRVGEVFVVEKMLECASPIGGEGNGGVIYPAVHPCRDSLAGSALILESLAQEKLSLAEMRQLVPSYALVKEKLYCPPRELAPSLRMLQQLFPGVPRESIDGLKFIWPDRWLQARASHTEPVLRLTAEAPLEEQARQLLLQALECLSPTV